MNLPPPPATPIKLAIAVPCFNEEEMIDTSALKLEEKISSLISKNIIAESSFICFIDDGSRDATWRHIEGLHKEKPHIFRGIKLSRNRGHQNALLCGLLTLKDHADAVISMDADLQDDIDTIDEMLKKSVREKCEIVYGVRNDRTEDSRFKRVTAQGFYKLLHFLGADIIYNHADFRLMTRAALSALSSYGEVNLFLRGIIPMLGYKSGIVCYTRKTRMMGVSKYPLRKMLSFAFDGITSLSIRPIRLITFLGFAIFLASIIMAVNVFIQHYLRHTAAGWSSTMVSIWVIGGLIILSIGIVGEYVGKIYMEAKSRPRWHIEKALLEN